MFHALRNAHGKRKPNCRSDAHADAFAAGRRRTARIRDVAFCAAWAIIPFAASGAETHAADTISVAPDAQRFGDVGETPSDWRVTLGGGVIYMPEYEGSDEFKAAPFPLVSISFRDSIHIDPSGAVVDLYKWNGFRASVKGGYELGRQEDDSDHLRGLGDIDTGGVVGGLISYERGPFEVYAELDKTIGGSEGLIAKTGIEVSHRYRRFVFSGDVSATWADEKHMQAYFGVTPAQAANSELPEYEASAGIKRFDVSASVTHMLTEKLFLTGSVGAGVLLEGAKESPIVRDEIQPFGMLGLGYRF